MSCAIAAVFAGSAMQAQANALPALNFPRPGLVDATDSVRPVTLRGLSPDHVLELVSRARCRSISTARVSGATWCFAAPVAA